MYQKILILFAVLAGGVVLLSAPASAKEIKNGIEYWTVSEMREFMLETEAEFNTICGNDGHCKRDLLYERAETNGQYRALESFEMEKLILSSVNPTAETIKLYYQNEDKMLSYMLGRQRTSSIEDLYMLWVEEWLGNPFQNGSWLTYGERYPYFLGDAATVESASHLMIDEDKNRNGADWFTPNVEREYSVAGSGISNNTVQMFYYSLLEANGGRTNGVKDYRSCFDNTDYQQGIECRYLFGSDGVSRYFPFSIATTGTLDNADVPTINDTPITTNSQPAIEESDKKSSKNNVKASQNKNLAVTPKKPVIIEVSSSGNRPSQTNSTKNSETANTDTAGDLKDTTSSSNGSVVKNAASSTPNVTLPKSGSCEKETIFPWWFIIMVAICDAIIMWFFWPKKSEKGVDKRGNLR